MSQHNGLSAEAVKFVQVYLENGGKAGPAFQAAYPESTKTAASVAGPRLLRRPEVQDMILSARARALALQQAAIDQYAITAERVAECLAHMAMSRLDQVCDWSTVVNDKGDVLRRDLIVRDRADIDHRALYAVQSIKRGSNGELTISLPDKRACLMDIARLKGWVNGEAPAVAGVSFVVQR